MEEKYTVAQHIIHRLKEAGVGHLFGVPGDYNLDFLDHVMVSDIQWIGTCNELNAGYAADGYARSKGVGAALVTYGVGGFSIINAIAGSYAEQVPVILINGAPPARRREAGAMVHHLVSHYYLQLDIFKTITADAVLLTDPNAAQAEIDRVIRNVMVRKLPGYIELPADMINAPCRRPDGPLVVTPPLSDPESLEECVNEAAQRINDAGSPVILAGPELGRYSLGKEALQLIETSEVPFASMLNNKSVLPELHPQYLGIYLGAWSKEHLKAQVENSDCLISLGTWMTDLDTGLFTVNLDNKRMISVGGGQVRIGNHFYHQVQLADFIRELTKIVKPRSYLASHPAQVFRTRQPFKPEPDTELTAPRLYQCLNAHLSDEMVLLAEPGDAFCAAPQFQIDEAENFIVQSYYCSIGYCTPAALGVGVAKPGKRPVVLTGDGAFQMTAQEISTLIRQRCPAIIILINNDGYLIERKLHQDGMYNDLQMWKYADLPGVFDTENFATGIRACTEEEIAHAMETAVRERDRLVFIEAVIPNFTCSAGLDRLGETFRQGAKK